MQTQAQILQQLTTSKPYLKSTFGVKRLALFGSVARKTAHNNSDIDIWIDFGSSANAKQYFGVLFYLEDLFGTPIDLVTDKALRPELRPFVEREMIYV